MASSDYNIFRAVWPAFAGVRLIFTINELRAKGFSLVNNRAAIPLLLRLVDQDLFFLIEIMQGIIDFSGHAQLNAFDLSIERIV